MWMCKKCKNHDRFLVDANINATAEMDGNGSFIDWQHVNFEDPGFFRRLDQGTVICAKCNSVDIIDLPPETIDRIILGEEMKGHVEG